MRDEVNILLLNAFELSAMIKNKAITCRRVMEIYLDHIDRTNPLVNAIISLRSREALLAEADEKDLALQRGDYQGWLHGFPFAVKDLAFTKGVTTTLGCAAFADNIPSKDSLIVERIKSQGAIVIGKTNTPEFGLGSQTYNSVFGATANAWNHQLTAGGSSGGTASALAMYMLPVADGSDMMGSLRNPAAFNNIYGFRPSQGRVPLSETSELYFNQMATEGPMGRCVQDVALLLATLAGRDDRAPLSLEGDGAEFTATLESDCHGLKVGWLGDLDGHLSIEEGVLPLCGNALSTLSAIGCHVTNASLDSDLTQVWQAWCQLRQASVAHALLPLYSDSEKRKLLKPEAIWEIENGLSLSAGQLMQAASVRTDFYRAMLSLFAEFDYLVLPAAQVFPFDKTIHWPTQIAGKTMDTYHRWMEVTIYGSLSGCPVASVPAGFNEAGLPTGIQIIGKPQCDMDVLRLAYAYERAWQGKSSTLPPTIQFVA
ncbi:amidase [Pantoea cypripedii]|uniref:Amidase n=1 Tax=Pantoea cypripedii TaxID=55209 RepID=A0A1X1EL46_PANCY|nr:amidase [Pantoea cypripedii]MBP2198752.1 amidase [Pantoea cypripedii]ORM89563.1 amidase [Pantoea cypripedii]